MSDLVGDASRRVVANSQAKYLYGILGGLGAIPVVLGLFSPRGGRFSVWPPWQESWRAGTSRLFQ